MRPAVVFMSMFLVTALAGGGIGGERARAALGTNPGPMGTGTASAGSGTPGVDTIRHDMLAAVNSARSVGRRCGSTLYGAAKPVTWDDRIAAAALRHSGDMAAKDFFSHIGSDSSSAGDRLTDEGYPWISYGENISVGHSSVTDTIQALLASAGHCANIMNPRFTQIGAAFAQGLHHGSPVIYWTLDLAKK